MKRSLGFTLIELVIVIVILGILAVVAAPKFMSIQSDARKADLQQLAATLKSTIATVNAKAMIEGKETALSDTVDGISIANGYPTATDNGILKTVHLSDSWHYYSYTTKDLLKMSGYTGYTGYKSYSVSSVLGTDFKVGVMLFSLKNLSSFTDQKPLETGGCYVMYRDIAVKQQIQNNSHDDESLSWFWKTIKKIKEAIISMIRNILGESKDDGEHKNIPISPSFKAPNIIVVDNNC